MDIVQSTPDLVDKERLYRKEKGQALKTPGLI